MMDKDKLERIVREAGMRPERRDSYRDHDIFISDGFSQSPHQAYRRFGIEPDEFPRGMYVTLWWISKRVEELDFGQPLFFDALHNMELDIVTRKHARINRALAEARGFIDRRRKASDAVH